VEAEAAQLSQVVMNLIMNAAESLQDGAGRIEIRTGMLEIDSAPPGALFADTMTPGRHVWFEVADSGCGMDPDTCSRIFDPFFTTKFTGRGLGLAAVAGIVRGHRGAIEVSSIPGEGTRFRVLLPASAGGAEVGAPRAEPTRSSTRRLGTVLVIDDDEGVREIAEAVLHRSGLSVLTASDGHEGVKLFGLHADEIDVILLDRTMPSLSGAETFDAIRAVRGDARIVLVSGYTQERATAELAGRGLFGFLRKPFAPEELLERVQQALDD
jgi:CheY-like chemotaxis protein